MGCGSSKNQKKAVDSDSQPQPVQQKTTSSSESSAKPQNNNESSSQNKETEKKMTSEEEKTVVVPATDEEKAKVKKLFSFIRENSPPQESYHLQKRRGWKTVRLFISSTFTDMYNEREVLVKKVIPTLQSFCAQRQLRIVPIDLRCGVQAGTSADDTVRICLGELERCRQENPDIFFLNLLSERYGWIPSESDVSEEACELYKWVDGVSITTMEILQGALRSGNPNAIFMLRQSTTLDTIPKTHLKMFEEANGMKQEMMVELKNIIAEKFKESAIIPYEGEFSHIDPQSNKAVLGNLEAFEKKALTALKEVISNTYAPLKKLDEETPEEREERLQEKFIQSRVMTKLIGRAAFLKTLLDDIAHGERGFINLIQKKLVEVGSSDESEGEPGEVGPDGPKEEAMKEKKTSDGPINEKLSIESKLGGFCQQHPGHLLCIQGTPGVGKSAVVSHLIHAIRVHFEKQANAPAAGANQAGQNQAQTTSQGQLAPATASQGQLAPATASQGQLAPATASQGQLAPATADSAPAFKRRKSALLTYMVGSTQNSVRVSRMLEYLSGKLNRMTTTKPMPEMPTSYREQCAQFARLLQLACALRTVVLVVDSVDQLEGGVDLGWLPSPLPVNCVVVISCLRGPYSKLLQRRVDAPLKNANRKTAGVMHELKPLAPADCRQLVKTSLAFYRKELDSKQMQILQSKAEASSPLYLSAACEEIRIYGIFETLTTHIENLGPTVEELFKQVLKRLEVEQGEALVRTTIQLIVCSLTGVTEFDLLEMLVEHVPGFQHHHWTSLNNSLLMYLRNDPTDSSSLISFFHRQFTLTARAFYLTSCPEGCAQSCNGGVCAHILALADTPEWKEKDGTVCSWLADHYLAKTDPEGDNTWANDELAPELFMQYVSDLPELLIYSRRLGDAAKMMMSLSYLRARLEANTLADLIQDFRLVSDQLKLVRHPDVKGVREFENFLLRKGTLGSSELVPLALNEPPASTVAKAARQMCLADPTLNPVTWINLREVSPAEQLGFLPSEDPVYSVRCGPNATTALDSRSNALVACTTQDSVFLYDVNKMDTRHVFPDRYTAGALCFSSDGNYVACGSQKDGSMSIYRAGEGSLKWLIPSPYGLPFPAIGAFFSPDNQILHVVYTGTNEGYGIGLCSFAYDAQSDRWLPNTRIISDDLFRDEALGEDEYEYDEEEDYTCWSEDDMFEDGEESGGEEERDTGIEELEEGDEEIEDIEDLEEEEEEEEEEYDDELDDFDWFDSSVVGNLLAGMSAFKQGTRHVLMAASPQSIIITASDTAEAEKVQEEKLRARALFLEMMDNNSSDGSDISRQDFDKAVFCLKHNEEEEGEEEKEEEKKHLEDKANLLSHEIMVLHQSDLRDYLWENVKEEFLKKKLEGKKKKNKGGESEEGESEVTLESVEPLFAEDDVGFCEIAAAVLTPTRTPGPKEGEAEAEAASEDEPGVVYLHVVWVNGVYTVWRVAKIAHEPSPKANMQLVAVNRIIPAGNQKIDYAVFLNDGEFLLISTKRNLLCHIYWLRHAIPQKISVFWGHDSDLLDATLYSATPQSSENEESVSGWAAKLRKKAAKTLSQFGAAAAKVPEIVLFTSSFDMSVRKWKINAETTTKIMNPTGDCVKHIPLYFSSEFTMPKQSSYLVEDLKDRALTGLGNKLGAAKMMKLNSGIQKLKAKFHDLPTSIGVTHSGAIQLLELLPPVFHESGSLQLEALSACDEGDLYLWDVLTGTSIAIPTGEDMKASAICGTETHFLVIVDDVENEEEDDDDYDFDDEYGIYDNDSEEECEEEEGEGQDDEAQEAEDGPTEETEEAGGEEEGGEEEAGNEYWGGVDEDYSFEPPIDVRMFQRFKGGEARMQRTLENSMDWISIEKKYTGDEKCYIEPVLCASPDGQLAVLFHKGTFAIIHIPTLSEVYSDNWGMLNNGIQHVKWAGKNKNAVLGPDENGFFTQHLVVACQAECDNHEGAGVLKDGGLVRVRVRYAHDHGDGSYFPERDDMKMEVDYVAGSLWSEDGFDDVQVSADGSTIVAIDGTLVFVGQIDHDNSAFAISVVARNRDSDSDEDLEDPENASPNFFDFYEGWVDAISVSDDGELVVFCAGNNTLYGLRRGDCDGSPCYDYHWEHTMENIESIDKIKALSKDVIAVTDGLKGTFILGLKTEHTECEGPDDNAYTEAVLLSAFHPGKDKYCSFDACHVPEANAKTLRPHWMAGGESDKFDGVVYSITGGLAGSPAIVRTDLQLPKASTPEDDEEKGLGE